MKKLLCVAIMGMVLVGCGGKENKVMTCNMTQEQNGVSLNIEIKYEYQDDLIKKQKQVGKVITGDETSLDMMYQVMDGLGYKDKSKDMDGVTYSIEKNTDKLEIVEKLNIDLDKVSLDDYNTMTNQKQYVSGDKVKMSLEKTEESMKKQGLTCTK